MSAYETILMTKPELTEEQLKQLTQQCDKWIKKNGGVPGEGESLGSFYLGYEIASCDKGKLIQLGYTGDGKTVAELERNLKLDEQVIRFITVKCGKPQANKAKPARRTEGKASGPRRGKAFKTEPVTQAG